MGESDGDSDGTTEGELSVGSDDGALEREGDEEGTGLAVGPVGRAVTDGSRVSSLGAGEGLGLSLGEFDDALGALDG